jgi:hypothetical protein
MTILSKDILAKHGPFIRFADCQRKLNDNQLSYPCRSNFDDNVFFEMSEFLLGTLGSVTNTGSPIDPYEFVQLTDSYKIRMLASELLIWTFQLTRAGPQVFKREVEGYSFYEGSLRAHYDSDLNGEHLRLDMIETLLLLIGKFSRIAQAKRCLVIAGV